ncbi:MAG: hypothetical protein NTX53_02525 [candidate division WOR-3 bacterium]|nr:hypothetical protein [candidate division WOR-3 bacterium]
MRGFKPRLRWEIHAGFRFNDFTVIYEEQTATHIRGRIGSGASSITISTTNGDITVRRRS